MFCCMGYASSKNSKIKPKKSAQNGDIIHVWENKQIIKSVKVGNPNYVKRYHNGVKPLYTREN